jgi:hypothetical protein
VPYLLIPKTPFPQGKRLPVFAVFRLTVCDVFFRY